MIMITDYSEEQFQVAYNHMTYIREHNPNIEFNFIGCPIRNEALEKRLAQSGHIVKQFRSQEFMSWTINNVSNTVN